MTARIAVRPRVAARESYRATVEAILPACPERALQLRCSLLLMRDNASSALRRAGDDAADVLLVVERLVTRHAFRPLGIAQLDDLRASLVRLTAVASALETFARAGGEADDAPRGR